MRLKYGNPGYIGLIHFPRLFHILFGSELPEATPIVAAAAAPAPSQKPANIASVKKSKS
jgi:hypothetical protein